MRKYNEIELWKDVTEEQWNDWRWQVRNRITDIDTLSKVINLTEDEVKDIGAVMERFRVGITPYYASLMDPDDPNCQLENKQYLQ